MFLIQYAPADVHIWIWEKQIHNKLNFVVYGLTQFATWFLRHKSILTQIFKKLFKIHKTVIIISNKNSNNNSISYYSQSHFHTHTKTKLIKKSKKIVTSLNTYKEIKLRI